MKYFLITLFILTGSTAGFGQADITVADEQSKLTMGLEIDVYPYISGGYYASIWLGFKEQKQRIRPVISKFDTPEFMNADGITLNTINSYAVFTDYFFKPGFEKFWIATGIEYWDGIAQKNKSTNPAKYAQWIFTLGVGYVWKYYNNFYLSPWLAGSIRIAGDEEVQFGEDVSKLPLITPFFSLKLGWHF